MTIIRHLIRDRAVISWIMCLAPMLGACGPTEPVEFRVGERTVTVAEADRYLVDQIARLPVGRARPTRQELMPKLAQRLQLAATAERQGLHLDPLLEARNRSERKYAVLRLMGPTVIDTTLDLGIDDARRKYRDKNEERRARQIVVADLDAARQIRNELQEGADFEKLALKRSEAARVRYTRGDLGWSKRGRMVEAVNEALFSMEVGDCRIVETEHGHHVLQATEERFEEPAAADSIYAALLTQMKEEEIRQREADFFTAVLERSALVWNESICEQIASAARSGDGSPTYLLERFQADSSLTLLEMDGQRLTLGSALAEYATYNPGRRATFKNAETVKHFFRGMALENKLYREGIEKGLGDDPRVIEITRMGVEIWLADRAKELLFANAKSFSPPEAAIKADYEARRDNFVIADRMVVGEISTRSELRIQEADSLLKGGAPFKAVASRYSQGLTARSGGHLGPFEQTYRPERWAQADTLEIGERTPPIATEKEWVIVELRKRVPARQLTFDEARRSIAHRLKKERRAEREQEVQGLLDEWFPVEGMGR